MDEIAQLIERIVRERLDGGVIQSVSVVRDTDHHDETVFRVTVVFDQKGSLDAHKTVGLARHIRHELLKQNESTFPNSRSSQNRMPRGGGLKPLDLLSSAELLVAASKGKPSQANLRRATSAAYYALFHCLARSSADLFVGGEGADRSKHAWKQVYRAIDHGQAGRACQDKLLTNFPKPIEDFANTFVTMQTKRHSADYDPASKFTKSEVSQDIVMVREAIMGFSAQPLKDRRAFCAFVLFKRRL